MCRLLKNKNFRNLLIAQTLSPFEDIQRFLILVFLTSKDTKSISFEILEMIPFLTLSLFAGSIVDRYDRKKIMFSTSFLTAIWFAIMYAVTFSINNLSPMFLFIFLITTISILSFTNVFSSTAKNAALPKLIASNKLVKANSMIFIIKTMMPLFWFVVASPLSISLTNKQDQYFLRTLCVLYTLMFLLSSFFTKSLPQIQPENNGPFSLLKDIMEGIKYILNKPVIKIIVIAEGFFYLVITYSNVVISKASKLLLIKGSNLMDKEVTFFLGTLVGALITANVKVKRPTLFYIIATTIHLLGTALIAYSKQMETIIVVDFIIGLTIPLAIIPIYSYVQQTVEDKFQGRVNGIFSTIQLGFMPLCIFATQKILDTIQPEHILLITGLFGLTLILITFLTPDFRKTTF